MDKTNNIFDSRARTWDINPVHQERSGAIAAKMLEMIPVNNRMRALEYGAGTGILGSMLAPHFKEIVLMDSSKEMVEVMKEKISANSIENLNPVVADLEKEEYLGEQFDLIYSQMVFHHINDVGFLLGKLYKILKPGGYIAIADLYKEDGSFHGEGFSGHNGFDVELLKSTLESENFRHTKSETCFIMKKSVDNQVREFPVFLMIGRRDL
jgi:ubiquinone/menaquinone biosynthesis C-methylase UbiE